MTLFNRLIRGLHMPQFTEREYFGYSVYVYPDINDRPRRYLHKKHFDRLPYFAGSDVLLTLSITPLANAEKCSELQFTWHLIPEEIKDVPNTSGTGIVNNPTQLFTSKLYLPHISFPNNYRLDFEVSVNGKSLRQCVADLEITPRSASEFNFIWSVWAWGTGLVGVIVGGIIGYLVSYFLR